MANATEKKLEGMARRARPFTRARVQSHDPDSHIDSHLPQLPTFPSPPADNPNTKLAPRTMTGTTTTRPAPLPQPHHYIRFAISPPLGSADALEIRRLLQEALAQSFGATLSHIYLDVLSVTASGDECVIRAHGPR